MVAPDVDAEGPVNIGAVRLIVGLVPVAETAKIEAAPPVSSDDKVVPVDASANAPGVVIVKIQRFPTVPVKVTLDAWPEEEIKAAPMIRQAAVGT